jgi:integrase
MQFDLEIPEEIRKRIADLRKTEKRKAKPLLAEPKQYAVKINGHKYRRYFLDPNAAEDWQLGMKLKVQQHETQGTQEGFKAKRFTEAAVEFIEGRVNLDSYDHDAFRLRTYLLPYFGNRFVHEITRNEWLAYFGDAEKKKPGKVHTFRHTRKPIAKGTPADKIDGKALAPRTINLIRTMIHTFYEECRVKGWVYTNPISDIPPMTIAKKRVPHLSTGDDIRKYLDAAHGDFHASYWVCAMIFLNTGLREGNVIGLKWSDVHWSTRQIVVQRKWNRKTKQFKSGLKAHDGEEFILGINDALYEALLSWKNSSKFTKPEDFIVTDRRGKPLTDKMVWCCNQRTLRRAGLTYIKPHALRHTYGTHFIENGGTVEQLQRLLNHSTPIVTSVYTHNNRTKLVERANTVNFSASKPAQVTYIRSNEKSGPQ